MIKFFQNQIDEISTHKMLRIYGAVLSLLLASASVLWISTDVTRALGPGTEAICWPMFPECQDWRVLPVGFIKLILWSFLGLSVLNSALFLNPRWTKQAYWMFCALTLLKLCILAFDYRFRLNQHMMHFWVTLGFLFFPKKEATLKVLVALFYFWSGLLKLNPEWLSGSALYKMPWLVTPELVTWACTYVVVLEVGLVWLLFFERRWVQWAVLVQLYVFHVVSYPVVGFFYPLTMFGLLMIFPLNWGVSRGAVSFRAVPVWTMALLFSGVQFIPRLMPGDTAITGEGRLFALHMFDAKTSCEAYSTVTYKDNSTLRVDLKIPQPVRIHCDPITYLSRVRFLCQNEIKMNPRFKSLDLTLRTRRSNETLYHTVVDIKDVCPKDLRYSLISHNSWIQTDQKAARNPS